MRLCQPDIRRYAQRNCLIGDVDDAVQEALLVLSRKRSSVRVVAAFSGWLFQIVKRECHRLARAALHFDPWDDARAEEWLASQDTAAIKSRLHRASTMAREYLIG